MAAEMLQKADEILGYSISNICFDGPVEDLKKTVHTQPALFLHSAINFDLTKDKLNFEAVAGHSVGEFAALYAAGVLDFESALKLVARRGQLMFEIGEEVPGTMFAIIGMADDKVEEICNKLHDEANGNICVPANFNATGQVVISGSAEYLRENIGEFKSAGARMVQELTVSGAFHSPLMQPAKEELEKAINETTFSDAKIPVYSNVYAKPLTKANDIKEALIAQLTSPVKWTQSLIEMDASGIENYIEIGPSAVLQGLVKRTLRGKPFSGIDTAEQIDGILNN
jgi:[acyl-carrier-protein] S-malonyltransferase